MTASRTSASCASSHEDGPQAITPSDKERQAGVYSPRNLQRVLGALHQDGLVVLRNVIDREHIDSLNAVMTADAEKYIADPKQEFNHNVKSNFLQRPPVTESSQLYEDVYFNSFLLQVANAHLGQKPVWNWLTANTAIASTPGLRQPVHKDSAFDHPRHPYYFIANVPLCDVGVVNGATEFWLGSHVDTSVRDQQVLSAATPDSLRVYSETDRIPWIADDVLAARRRVRPPVQPHVHRGDVLVRDLRLWHAGMPNSSDAHRIMLGLGYMSPIHPNYKARLHLPLAQQDFFVGAAKGRVEVRANFYNEDEFAQTTRDTYFDIRPQYGDDK